VKELSTFKHEVEEKELELEELEQGLEE